MRKPRALRSGDRVAVLAPASPFDRELFDQGVEELRVIGFEPVFDESVFARRGYLAGPAADRASALRAAWRDPTSLLAWANRPKPDGPGLQARYFRFADRTGEVETLGEGILTRDGHMTYSPDGRWLLTDEYPDPQDRKRTLILYCLADGARVEVGRYYAPPEIDGELRCDLHPRFNRDGTQVCFDSAHEGSRQVYVMDVGQIVGG